MQRPHINNPRDGKTERREPPEATLPSQNRLSRLKCYKHFERRDHCWFVQMATAAVKDDLDGPFPICSVIRHNLSKISLFPGVCDESLEF